METQTFVRSDDKYKQTYANEAGSKVIGPPSGAAALAPGIDVLANDGEISLLAVIELARRTF